MEFSLLCFCHSHAKRILKLAEWSKENERHVECTLLRLAHLGPQSSAVGIWKGGRSLRTLLGVQPRIPTGLEPLWALRGDLRTSRQTGCPQGRGAARPGPPRPPTALSLPPRPLPAPARAQSGPTCSGQGQPPGVDSSFFFMLYFIGRLTACLRPACSYTHTHTHTQRHMHTILNILWKD